MWTRYASDHMFASYLFTIENTSYVQVLYQLNMAASSVDDLDEWLRIFNVKLKHMREDIQSVCNKRTLICHRLTSIYIICKC